jgi:TolB-like protein/DNA-binding SARP family transcriptional activator
MVRLRVLGGFALEGPPGAAAPQLAKRRAEAVLAVLAVSGELGCTRERLLALLWPESDEARSRHGLRDALHGIRRGLGADAVPPGGRLLRLDSSVVSSDVLQFTQALAAGRPGDAVRAYTGPLLDGFHVDDAAEFERWLDGERTRLAREYVEALKLLATAAERAGARDEAVGWWARAVEHDPTNSDLVLRQVRLLAAMGDRASAIKAAEGHARRLREEFDLEPDREILATIERIRRGEWPAPREDAPHAAPTPRMEVPRVAEQAAPPLEPPAAATRALGRVPRWVAWAALAVAFVLAGALGAGRLLRAGAAGAGALRTSVAVLPFRNLSTDTSYAFFAGGLHDELQTQLTKVASLRVVGPTSVGAYADASKPTLRQIGEELGVGSLVEGSVQVVGSRLRVTVQLLDPFTQAELWAESYDRTLDDAFAVESDIAKQVVAAVGATLTSAEAGAIAAAPTRNAQAYAFYLQGLDYRRRPGILRENLLIAQQLYERALGLDSVFAPAHAALSAVHWEMYRLSYDPSPIRLTLARREADEALRLAPDLPQAHLAVGVARYYGRGDFRGTLREYELGLRGAPNDAELWAGVGRIQRDLGNWDSALTALGHARRLDPRNVNLLHTIGDTYHFLRRYREAIETYRQALELAPDLIQTRLSLAWSYVLWKGELDTLRAVLRGLPPDLESGVGGDPVGNQRLTLVLWERRPDSALSLLRAMRPAASPGTEAFSSRVSWAAQAHSLLGDTSAARAGFDSAVASLDAEGRARPDAWWIHASRGFALAALGRRADALREARWLEQSGTYREDRYASGPAQGRARILAGAGEVDAALTEIEGLLARPSLLSVHELRLNPDFDPIRNDPRFQALLLKFANPGR